LPLAEEFCTLQGEGFNAGRAVYFIRLGGCDAACVWCDARETWDARRFSLTEVEAIAARAAAHPARAAVVTGGEPLLHPLDRLTDELRRHGFETLLETAGTHPPSGSFDWICLSPKRQRPPLPEIFPLADELKVIVAGDGDFAWAEECAARISPHCRLYLQPEWSCMAALAPAIAGYIKANPRWRASLQMHKFLNIP
jgi:organic radical activating enzyme